MAMKQIRIEDNDNDKLIIFQVEESGNAFSCKLVIDGVESSIFKRFTADQLEEVLKWMRCK